MSHLVRAKPTILNGQQEIHGPAIIRFFLLMLFIIGRTVRFYPVQCGAFCVAGILLFSAVSTNKAPIPYSEARVIAPDLEEELESSIKEDIVFVKTKPVKRQKASDFSEPAKYRKFESTERYIATIAPLARKYGHKYHVLPAIIIAQGIVESSAKGVGGNSALAVENNNHFGHKCFSTNCKKGHCTNRTDDTHKDFFMKYPSLEACVKAHAEKLSQGRYKNLSHYGTNYKKWAYGLKRRGYATANHYATTLIATIEKFNLQRYN